MSSYYDRPPAPRRPVPPPRRRGRGCLAWAVALVWIALIAVFAYRYFLRDQVSAYIGQQIGGQLQAAPTASVPLRPGEPTPIPAANSAVQQVLPTAIAALPSGEVRFSDTQVNQYLAGNANQIKPLDSATMRFVPGEVQVELRALGMSSTLRSSLAIQNGQIVAVDPQIDGPLGNVISARDVIQPFQAQINNQLAAQGRRVTDVRIEQGAVVLRVEE